MEFLLYWAWGPVASSKLPREGRCRDVLLSLSVLRSINRVNYNRSISVFSPSAFAEESFLLGVFLNFVVGFASGSLLNWSLKSSFSCVLLEKKDKWADFKKDSVSFWVFQEPTIGLSIQRA
ncbi:hypothetical protein NL676_025338 [Syzygium grande]|nr:hypothetical protein NL676_025338 [Syzygium grande]